MKDINRDKWASIVNISCDGLKKTKKFKEFLIDYCIQHAESEVAHSTLKIPADETTLPISLKILTKLDFTGIDVNLINTGFDNVKSHVKFANDILELPGDILLNEATAAAIDEVVKNFNSSFEKFRKIDIKLVVQKMAFVKDSKTPTLEIVHQIKMYE